MFLKLTNIIKETPQHTSYIFEKPLGFAFYPGQYLDIQLHNSSENNSTRAFTISSSPTEKYLMISTTTGTSEFKKQLALIKPHDTVESSHPAGTFILDETEPAIFLAGGVGITPFRSMIKYAVDNKLKIPITLFYSNSDENFLFKNELNTFTKLYPNLIIHYINTSIQGRLDQNKLQSLDPLLFARSSIFYLAGPPSIVETFKQNLTRHDIDEVNIRTDSFDGYQ